MVWIADRAEMYGHGEVVEHRILRVLLQLPTFSINVSSILVYRVLRSNSGGKNRPN